MRVTRRSEVTLNITEFSRTSRVSLEICLKHSKLVADVCDAASAAAQLLTPVDDWSC